MSEADLLIYADSSEFDLLSDTESENATAEVVQETSKPEHKDDNIPRL